ncbi:MAG: hypothetical protein ACI9EF_001983 [Pseudohongiellaceae bacterium]|jgi:hypothetical protein
MKISRLFSALSVAALLPFFLAGCSSPSAEKGGESRADYPDWYFQGGGMFKEDGGEVIYAVGIARQGPSVNTTRDIARQNARAEITRILGSHMQGMITTYTQRAGDYYEPDTFSDVENFENVTRNLSESFLSGSHQVDAFYAVADDSFCVLMRLDLKQSDIIEQAKKSMRENFSTKMRDQQTKALGNMDDAFAEQDARLAGVPAAFPQD